jgi:hypothetical protein
MPLPPEPPRDATGTEAAAPATGTVDWIVAAGPEAPGVAEALSGPRRVLFTGAGLAWLRAGDARLARLRAAGADLALCSRSARDAGLGADATPVGVRWSSVATWLAELGARPFGALLP